MIAVRVFAQDIYPPKDEKPIWEGDLHTKNEEKELSRFVRIRNDPFMQGEMVAWKFSDENGSGCKIEGALLAIIINEKAERYEVDLHVGADKCRTW